MTPNGDQQSPWWPRLGNVDTACFSAGMDAANFGILFQQLLYELHLDELKTSNITRDIGTVTDSPPSPFMNLFKCQHAFSGVELA